MSEVITLLEQGQKPEKGKMYLLRERYDFCPDGKCQVQYLTEAEKKDVQDNNAVYLSGIAQRADAQNGNGRVYPYHILAREVEAYKKIIKEARAYGACDHPDHPIVELQQASHRIVDIWWEGKDVYVKLKVHSTPAGEIVKTILREGGAIGLSSRALGNVQEDQQGRLIVDGSLKIICWDIVSEPSTHGAFMYLVEVQNNIGQILKENKNAVNTLTKFDIVNRKLIDILGT